MKTAQMPNGKCRASLGPLEAFLARLDSIPGNLPGRQGVHIRSAGNGAHSRSVFAKHVFQQGGHGKGPGKAVAVRIALAAGQIGAFGRIIGAVPFGGKGYGFFKRQGRFPARQAVCLCRFSCPNYAARPAPCKDHGLFKRPFLTYGRASTFRDNRL